MKALFPLWHILTMVSFGGSHDKWPVVGYIPQELTLEYILVCCNFVIVSWHVNKNFNIKILSKYTLWNILFHKWMKHYMIIPQNPIIYQFEMSMIYQELKINLSNDLLHNHLKKIGIIEITYKTRLITNTKRKIYRLFKEKSSASLPPFFFAFLYVRALVFKTRQKSWAPLLCLL